MLSLTSFVNVSAPAANDAQVFDPRTVVVKVGQRLRHGHGLGTIVAIHGEQQPRGVRHLGGVSLGGMARFDIVYDDGVRARQVPEAIVRGLPYMLLPQVAPLSEVESAIALADLTEANAKAAAEAESRAYKAECDQLASMPEYADYDRGSHRDTAAKNMRRELKRAFPGVKFSVTQERGVSSICVRWTGGPSQDEVEKVAYKFKRGHFDGMTDSYVHARSPWCETFGGADYISCSRKSEVKS